MSRIVIKKINGDIIDRINFNKSLLSIGRTSTNDIVLSHPLVSRNHALLERRNGEVFITDLNSSNGTIVNGTKINGNEPRKVNSGDEILIGEFILNIIDEEAKKPEPSASETQKLEKEEVKKQQEEGEKKEEKFLEVINEAFGVIVDDLGKKAVARKKLSDEELKKLEITHEIKQEIHRRLLEYMDLRKMDFSKTRERELRERTKQLIREIINEMADEIPGWISKKDLAKDVLDEALGLGPIEDFLLDPKITEIMVNSTDQIYIERDGKLELTGKRYTSVESLMAAIERIVGPIGRRIDESSPMVDARLKDGSRVNAIIPPLSVKGPVLTIRRFAKDPYSLQDLINFGTLTEEMGYFLKALVLGRKNVVISGGTGSGKTTLLNVVSSFIPNDERIITIEVVTELQLNQEHWISLEARPPNIEGKGEVTIRDLVRNSLRMRPDRIVVGECRGGEAIDMIQAMNTGHDGSLTTAHSNSPLDTLSRLETMVMMAGMDLPIKAIRDQIIAAINIIVHTARFPDGSRKITHISELSKQVDEHYRYIVNHIFEFRQTGLGERGKVLGDFWATGYRPTFIDELRVKGIILPDSMFEPHISKL